MHFFMHYSLTLLICLAVHDHFIAVDMPQNHIQNCNLVHMNKNYENLLQTPVWRDLTII